MAARQVGLRAVLLCGAIAPALAGCAAVAPHLGDGGVQTHILTAPGPARASPGPGPVLLVAPPVARAGLDTRRMAYLQRPFELGYFARNEWADTPGRMLQPLLVQALEAAGSFQAVVTGPNSAAADLRLDTEILSLQQEFLGEPSVARLALRAQLTDVPSRRVLATHVFEAVEVAPTADPYGGVVALNRALHAVLERLVAFVTGARPPHPQGGAERR